MAVVGILTFMMLIMGMCMTIMITAILRVVVILVGNCIQQLEAMLMLTLFRTYQWGLLFLLVSSCSSLLRRS